MRCAESISRSEIEYLWDMMYNYESFGRFCILGMEDAGIAGKIGH